MKMALYRLCVAAACLLMAHASLIDDVQDLNYEPTIAIECGKVPQHLDTNTGQWHRHEKEFCANGTKDILEYCKKSYPNIDVTNIVEANSKITLCDGDDCAFTVVPYRCLVGQYEADALTYPPDGECKFGYVHDAETCKGHDYWHERAEGVCKEKEKRLENYGILIACGIDLFTGVEYVCCKAKKTAADIFQDALQMFASHIPAISKGCNRSMYELRGRVLKVKNEEKVKDVAKQLNEAKDRREQLKQDDPEQAQSLYKSTILTLQTTLVNIEKQYGLANSQLHQERRECIQIDTNHKKHIAMRRFVTALQKHIDKPERVLKAFKSFMHALDVDQKQNARFLSRLLHSKSPIAKSARKTFAPHIDLIKATLKQGVELLKQVKSIEGIIDFDLPSWASDIDFEWAHKIVVKTVAESTDVNPTDPPPHNDPFEGSDIPPENEHEDFGDHPLKSRAVFAAVIGLSCGALVIMVVIVLALFFRQGSSKRPTKTVIAEDETHEKRHLLKMQQDGFENPTYKFFAR